MNAFKSQQRRLWWVRINAFAREYARASPGVTECVARNNATRLRPRHARLLLPEKMATYKELNLGLAGAIDPRKRTCVAIHI